MVPPLAELTAQAQTLSSAGDLVGARNVLTHGLDPRDVDPQRASPDAATAAALLARVLIGLGDPHAARPWAGLAHAAEQRLHGPSDERTVAACALHAAVLQRIGNHGRAAQLYHDLAGQLTTRDGPDSPRVLAAEADLATAEHAAGDCTAARDRLTAAWRRHHAVYGDAAPAGVKMLARLGAMERECGRHTAAREHLALAQELSARYLPADHPLARQTTALAGAPPSGRHTCGRVDQSAGPTQAGSGRAAAQGSSPATGWGATSGAQPGPASERAAGAAPVPRTYRPGPDLPPDERTSDPGGAPSQAPPYLSQVHQAPGDLAAGRHARVDTPPPPTGWRPAHTGDGRRPPAGSVPGQGQPAQAPSVRGQPVQAPSVRGQPVQAPSVRGQPVRDQPASSAPAQGPTDRRLPVHTRKPTRRSRYPFVLVAVLVLGIVVAAAVVLLTLPRAGRETTGAPTSAAPPVAASSPAVVTPTSRAPDGGAPTGVRLRDNRDSVSLEWGYPEASEGPVLISGGRVGQEQRAFQQLPAGTTTYVVYGLNERENYCFTIAVVYTTERVAASRPACTSR